MSFGRSGFGSGENRRRRSLGASVGGVSGIPTWVPSNATSSLDFVNNRGYDGTAGSAASKIAVSRANAGGIFNVSGNSSTVGANAARLSYDEENVFTSAPSGLLVEQGMTNGPGAIDYATAVVGTFSGASPAGSLPTGMGIGPVNNSTGLTYDVTAKDATSVTIHIHGTTPSSGPVIHLSLGTGAAAAASVVTAGFSAQLIAGTWANIGTALITIDEYNSVPAIVGQKAKALNTVSQVNGNFFNTDIPWPFEILNQTMDAGTVTAGPAIFFLPPTSSAIDVTFKITRAFIFNSAYRLAWQASASRAADNITVVKPIRNVPLSVNVAVRMPRTVGTGVLWQFDDGSQNNRITLRAADYGVFLTIVSSGSTLLDLSIADVPKYSLLNVAVALSSSTYAASVNGKPAKTGSVASPAGLTTERIGGDGTNYWNGFIRSRTTYNSALSGAQVQALSVVGLDHFDDFDRADGAVGVAPTGQTYTQQANNGTGIVVAAIASKFLKSTDAGLGGQTAAYTGLQLGSNVKLMSAMGVYATGTSGNGALLIASPGGVPPNFIIQNSLHIPFSDLQMSWQVWDNSSFAGIDQAGLSANATLDNATRSHCAWIVGGNAMLLFLSSGEIVRVVDSRFVTDNGTFAIYENFFNTAGDQYKFKSVAAEAMH